MKMRKPYVKARIMLATSLLFGSGGVGYAQQQFPHTDNPQAQLMALDALRRQDPRNLDNQFLYATLAASIKDHAKAAEAYEDILEENPNLPRIKLDLALSYIYLNRFSEAQRLLQEVLKGDVPPEVRKNVQPMLDKCEEELKTHRLQGSFAVGMHSDTNPASAPASGQIAIRFAGQDLNFTLDNNARRRSDVQIFSSLAATHDYRPLSQPLDDAELGWRTTGSLYKSEYNHNDPLNLSIVNMQTGPTFTGLDNKLNVQLGMGYTHILLDNTTFQKSFQGNIAAQYLLSDTTQIRGFIEQQRRTFSNTDETGILDIRDGHMQSVAIGATHALTQKDIVDADLRVMNEDTKRNFLDSTRTIVSAGYTRQFDDDWFARTGVEYSAMNFHASDPSISLKSREDHERSGSLTVGKSFDNITATMGYEYRDVTSNITNFEFDNHRITAMMSVRF